MRSKLVPLTIALALGVSAVLVTAQPAQAAPLPGLTGGAVTIHDSNDTATYTLKGRFAAGGRSVVTTASGRAYLLNPWYGVFHIHLTGTGLDAVCVSLYRELGVAVTGSLQLFPQLQYGEAWSCSAMINGGPATDLELTVSTTSTQPSAPVPGVRSGVFAGVDATTAPAIAKTSLGTYSTYNTCDHYMCLVQATLSGRISVAGRYFVGTATFGGNWGGTLQPNETMPLSGDSPGGNLRATCQWSTLQQTAATYTLMPVMSLSCVGSIGSGRVAKFSLAGLAPFSSERSDGHSDTLNTDGVFVGVATN